MVRSSPIGNRWLRYESNIVVQMLLVVVPLVTFTAVLLALVYIFAWKQRYDGLSLDTGFASGVLYINFSATRLILVASWSSSVALPLIGSLLSLTSYVVAADMIWSSKMSFHGLLPTPSQLAMLTDLLDAKKVVLLLWFSDLWKRSSRTIPSRWMIEFPAMVQIAALVLSGAILAADTWLHIATSSNTMIFLSNVDPTTMGPGYQYSRNISTECANSYRDACSVTLGGDNVNRTKYPDDIKSLMVDKLTYPTRINTSADGTYFLAPRIPQVASLANELNRQAYTARTLGTTASCEANITICNIVGPQSGSSSIGYFCPAGMNGTLEYPARTVGIDYWYGYYNRTYYQKYWSESGTQTYNLFGVVALLENTAIKDSEKEGRDKIPQFEYDPQDGSAKVNISVIATRCMVDMLVLDYSWHDDIAIPQVKLGSYSIEAADLTRGVTFAGYFNGSDFDSEVKGSWWTEAGLDIGPNKTVTWQNTTSDITKGLQKAMGKTSLALMGGTFDPMSPSALRLANRTVITVVGKTPLYTLVVLNLWYALFAVMLFVLAMLVLRDEATRGDIIAVQQLISVEGLATAAVKRQRTNLSLNDDDLRVGVEKVNGEWQFRVWEIQNSGQGKGLLADHSGTPM